MSLLNILKVIVRAIMWYCTNIVRLIIFFVNVDGDLWLSWCKASPTNYTTISFKVDCLNNFPCTDVWKTIFSSHISKLVFHAFGIKRAAWQYNMHQMLVTKEKRVEVNTNILLGCVIIILLPGWSSLLLW